MYCMVLSIRLFSIGEWIWCFKFRNLQAWGYQVPPSVETGCFLCVLTKLDRKRSAINMFLSLEIDSARICLFSGSMATQIQIYSEPILIKVSSTIYSRIFFFLSWIFRGLYFWIQFQMETWFLLNNWVAFLKPFWEKDLKSTNATHSKHTLKVFYFW